MSTSRTSPSFSRADLRSVTLAQDLYDTLVTGRRSATVRGAPFAAAPAGLAEAVVSELPVVNTAVPAQGILRRARRRSAAGQVLAAASMAVAALSVSNDDAAPIGSGWMTEQTVMSSTEALRAFADFAPASAASRPRIPQPWAEPVEIGRREPAITPAHAVASASGFGSAEARNAVRSLAASLRGTDS